MALGKWTFLSSLIGQDWDHHEIFHVYVGVAMTQHGTGYLEAPGGTGFVVGLPSPLRHWERVKYLKTLLSGYI